MTTQRSHRPRLFPLFFLPCVNGVPSLKYSDTRSVSIAHAVSAVRDKRRGLRVSACHARQRISCTTIDHYKELQTIMAPTPPHILTAVTKQRRNFDQKGRQPRFSIGYIGKESDFLIR